MKRNILLLTGILLLLLAGCDFSLAGDITPPPGAVISSEITPMPVEPPSATPDLARGIEIYANRCAPCHGANGRGDGEQAGSLPFYPSAIGDPDLARESSPEDWFRAISQGQLQRYMPPFESTLSEQQRWDVLAYVYGLGWDQETLSRGEGIYLAHQAAVDELLTGLSPISVDRSRVASLGLSGAESRDLTAYLQAAAVGMDSQSTIAEQAAPTTATSEAATLSQFSGHVIYGGAAEIPDGLQARLYGFDHTDQAISETTPVTTDGSFLFDGVPIVPGRIFFVQIDYKGLSFFSEFLSVDDPTQNLVLDVPIYDTTSDTSQLAVEKIQMIFDFPQAGTLRIVESVTISNLGDLAIAPDEGGKPVLHFSLPAQAANLAFEEGDLGDRYIADETGFGDMRAVLPGKDSYTLLFAFDLPYNSILTITLKMDFPTRAVTAFIPQGDIKIEGDTFALQGSQQINGVDHWVYAAEGGYSAGDQLALLVRGANPRGTSGVGLDGNLLIGMAALTAAIGFAWLWLRRLPEPSPAPILEQISSLDESYANGKISKAGYSRRRKVLKDRLRHAVESGGRK